MTVEKIERLSPNAERVAQLRELFPEVFTDGKVDVERLRRLLEDDAAEVEPGQAHYGLSWPGQEDARKLASKPPSGTLRLASGEGVDEDSTHNMLIVGDNLEVLRLLLKSYAHRVKLIYIDPPYNTGNDFVYKDDFRDPVGKYLEATKQADFTGVLTSNPRSGGRYHSNWLSFLYPRLVLARTLLKEDGVIFVSIDDHEVHNLRLMMDEIFGPENFIASVIWQKVFSPKNTARHFSEDHEYVIVYALDAHRWMPSLLPRTAEMEARYTNPDNDSRGVWSSSDMCARNYYSEGTYSVTCPSGRVISGPPTGTYWRVSKVNFDRLDREKRIWWGGEGNNMPRQKRFLSEVKDGKVPQTLWKYEDVGHTQESKKELLERVTFATSDSVFDTPKPTRLIEQVLRIGTRSDESDIVLDFFAGSGTTGEAVWKLNREDGGNRRFILVQLPEVTGYEDYPTISDITRTRLLSASTAFKREAKGKFNFAGGDGPDLGFKLLRQDASNLLRWQTNAPTDALSLPDLFRSRTGLKPGWKEENLLMEILLLEGFPLDASIQQAPDFIENRLMIVEHVHIPTRLLVCTEETIHDSTVELLLEGDHDKDMFVCLDAALTDTLKVRLADKLHRVKTL